MWLVTVSAAATCYILLLLLLHLFNGLFSSTTWVSLYQKGKTSLDLNEARDYGDTPSWGMMLFLTPNQQSQSTEMLHGCSFVCHMTNYELLR